MSRSQSRPMGLPVTLAAMGLLLLSLAGCGRSAAGPRGEPGQPDGAGATRAAGCPPRGQAHDGASAVMVEWLDFVHLNGRQYVVGPGERAHPPVRIEEVGPQIGVVSCKIGGSTAGSSYRPRDGDAGFLTPGTTVHAIRGVPPTQAVTAARDGRYQLYSAMPSW